ncbi:RadC family protein [Parasphingorhabdus marina]|nr:DNA repair protein RadC [Parasphingorhabdus marina]
MFSHNNNQGKRGGSDASTYRASRQKLRDDLGESLTDHELLCCLLHVASPRSDADTIARSLLSEFESFATLITASTALLDQVPGLTDNQLSALKIVRTGAIRMLSEPVRRQPLLASWTALLDYLRADMALLTTERVRILHLDTKNRLLRDELVSEGSVDEAVIFPREVLRRALELGSAAIILVHNHPSGDPTPSQQDIALTRDIALAGEKLGITVHDHIIIGRAGHVSLRSKGLI